MLMKILRRLLNGPVIEAEKRHLRRRAKRRLLTNILLFCGGFFVGAHRKAIWAYCTGKELPEAPDGHCCHRFKK